MCLRVQKNQRFKYATKDIVCYKALLSCRESIITPYVGIKINEDTLKGKVPFCAIGKGETRNRYLYKSVKSGYIHTFSENIGDDFLKFGNKAFKCIIPKGTRYIQGKFLGQDDKYYEGYASKKIVFVEKITIGKK